MKLDLIKDYQINKNVKNLYNLVINLIKDDSSTNYQFKYLIIIIIFLLYHNKNNCSMSQNNKAIII